MKRKAILHSQIPALKWFLINACFLGALSVFVASAYAAGRVQVQVMSTIVRTSPSPWAGRVSEASYQDQLTLLEDSTGGKSNQWLKVRTSSGKVGYVHVSAVTSRQVQVRGSSEGEAVSSMGTQVVLAGKGFSSKVENEYKRENPTLNFALVDMVERFKPKENIQTFAKKGKLLG